MKVYKRGSGLMWFMVSALLSITLNVKKTEWNPGNWVPEENAVYESHGLMNPTYRNSYCGSRRRGRVDVEKRESAIEEAGRETVHQRAWWKPPPLSDNHHFRVSQLRHCSRLINTCSMSSHQPYSMPRITPHTPWHTMNTQNMHCWIHHYYKIC